MVAFTWLIPALVFFTSIFGWQYFTGGRTVPDGRCYVQYMDDALFNLLLQVSVRRTLYIEITAYNVRSTPYIVWGILVCSFYAVYSLVRRTVYAVHCTGRISSTAYIVRGISARTAYIVRGMFTLYGVHYTKYMRCKYTIWLMYQSSYGPDYIRVFE